MATPGFSGDVYRITAVSIASGWRFSSRVRRTNFASCAGFSADAGSRLARFSCARARVDSVETAARRSADTSRRFIGETLQRIRTIRVAIGRIGRPRASRLDAPNYTRRKRLGQSSRLEVAAL